jgi:hypothetical protein
MTMKSDGTPFLGEAWFDPIEAGIREQICGFIEGLLKAELTASPALRAGASPPALRLGTESKLRKARFTQPTDFAIPAR